MKSLLRIIQFIWNHPLASRNRVKAFGKFISWQVSQQLNPHPVRHRLVESSQLMISKGMAGATGNVYTGLLEFNEMAFILHALRQGDVFADIGANIGVYTILAAKNAGAAVLSVEPGEITLKHLETNIRLNKVEHLVTVFPNAVGMTEENLQFVHSRDAINHVVAPGELVLEKECVTVTIKKLDDLFSGQVPSIIKIDIEGFEWPALNGAKRLLASDKMKALVIELNGSGNAHGFSDTDIDQLLMDVGFMKYTYDPFSRQLDGVESYGPFNTIYIKDTQWVRNRVEASRKFRIFDRLI